ncbi:HNH endonuclease signature motif containing protein [Flavimobilis marinus]|nr:HNH endonuclease signature motif containing protein [Flavimobilis marinus]
MAGAQDGQVAQGGTGDALSAVTTVLPRCPASLAGLGRCAGTGFTVCDACESVWAWRDAEALRCPPEPPAEWFEDDVDDAPARAKAAPLSGRELVAARPSAHLVAALDDVALGDLDDYDVVEVVAAWDRVASWVAARQLQAVATLAKRDAMNPLWPASAGNVARPNVTGEELAMRLGRSRRAADAFVDLARALDGPLTPTAELLERGELDIAQTTAIHRGLHDVPVAGCLDVQDALLDRAPVRTPAQLTGDVQRALIALDPGGAAGRVAQAARGRRVERPRALPHGMAGIWAVLPAPEALAVDGELDARARTLRAAGDPRTLDQLRADLFAGTLLGVGSPTCTARPQIVPPALAGQSLGLSAEALGLPGATPGLPGQPLGLPGDAGAPVGEATPADLDVVSRPRARARRSQINVTVSLTTLLGLADEPAELAGYGPIDPATARRLASEGTWRRIITDPRSGAVLDVGRTRYRPPADLADYVRHRDRACARPGCSASAHTAELDHTVEFHRAGGTTSHDNLGPLCRRDHQIKTDGGFALAQEAPGSTSGAPRPGIAMRTAPALPHRGSIQRRGKVRWRRSIRWWSRTPRRVRIRLHAMRIGRTGLANRRTDHGHGHCSTPSPTMRLWLRRAHRRTLSSSACSRSCRSARSSRSP